MLIFDDDTSSDVNREHVLERLSQVTLPANLVPQMGTDWSPVGQIYWYTLESTNPAYDVMEKKSLEDWTLEKSFKSVKGVVDVSSFGGPTKEYQIKLDPDKLIAYGLSIGQVEQQISLNNTNGGGSFIEQGAQQINVQSVGLYRNVQDIEKTVIKAQNGAPVRIRDIATVTQGPKIRLGQIGRATHRPDGTIVDNADTVEGIVLLQKSDDSDPVLKGIHKKVDDLNAHILPKGVKIVPFLDRSDLVKYTVETVEHNLTEGVILVAIILFLFLGNVRGAIIVALTISFALLFASICLDLSHIPANLLSLGALDFGMVVDGAVVMIENIVRHLAHPDDTRTPGQKIREGGARGYNGPSFTPFGIMPSPRIYRSLRRAGCGGPVIQANGVDCMGSLLLQGSAHILNHHCACAGEHSFQKGSKGVGESPAAVGHPQLPRRCSRGDRAPLSDRGNRGRSFRYCGLSDRGRRNRLRVSAPS